MYLYFIFGILKRFSLGRGLGNEKVILCLQLLQSPVGISELTVSVDLIDAGHDITGKDRKEDER